MAKAAKNDVHVFIVDHAGREHALAAIDGLWVRLAPGSEIG